MPKAVAEASPRFKYGNPSPQSLEHGTSYIGRCISMLTLEQIVFLLLSKMALPSVFVGLALVGSSYALVSRDGTGRLPAMGWSSWNEYECAINETVFLDTGALLISL